MSLLYFQLFLAVPLVKWQSEEVLSKVGAHLEFSVERNEDFLNMKSILVTELR